MTFWIVLCCNHQARKYHLVDHYCMKMQDLGVIWLFMGPKVCLRFIIHQLQTDTQPTQVMIRLKELAIIIGAGCFYNHQAKGVGFVVYY